MLEALKCRNFGKVHKEVNDHKNHCSQIGLQLFSRNIAESNSEEKLQNVRKNEDSSLC